jgi:CheY-like chemotaxis protein
MSALTGALNGKRILVVEDEYLIATLITTVLTRVGCVVAGPISTLATALEAARTEDVDGALLDVNLAGQFVFPVADVLSQRQIPFLFLTGYGASAIPDARRDWKVISKPFRSQALLAALLDCILVAHH